MFQSTLEILEDGICICDPSGEILYSNPAAERMARSLEECRIIIHMLISALKPSGRSTLREPRAEFSRLLLQSCENRSLRYGR
ncbi:PAS domain-containing protein [Methanothrix sp.]|uniref:PAS domain-containing protein n=1 Tax=Methanothrix sp. TaxID=90426 RepID=UPI0037431464